MSTKTKISLFFFALLAMLFSAQASAQTPKKSAYIANPSTAGTEFFVAYMNNNGTSAAEAKQTLDLQLVLTSDSAVQVRVSTIDPELMQDTVIQVWAHGVNCLSIPQSLYMEKGETNSQKVVHVEAVNGFTRFSAYAINRVGPSEGSSRDATILLPVEAYGEEYMIQTYHLENNHTQFVVIASEDNTTVTITASAAESGAGTHNLMKGEAVCVVSRKSDGSDIDMSGSTVCADKPVAVFTGNQTGLVPTYINGDEGDMLWEQQLPINKLGRTYYLALSKDVPTNAFLPTAVQDGTNIKLRYKRGGASLSEDKTLDQGETLDATTTRGWMPYQLGGANWGNNAIVESDKPLLLNQYFSMATKNITYDVDGNEMRMGDAGSALIPAWEQRVKSMTFYTQSIDVSQSYCLQYHYLQLITRWDDVNKLTLRDSSNTLVPINLSDFHQFDSDAGMAYGYIAVEPDMGYTISTTGDGFVGIVYGLSDDGQSYLYTLGFQHRINNDSLYMVSPEPTLIDYELEPEADGSRYLRQWDDFEKNHLRLDTAVICDGTTVNYSMDLSDERPIDKVEWYVIDCEMDGSVDERQSKYLVGTQDSDPVPFHLDFSHEFKLPSFEELEPDERDPYSIFQVRAVIYRKHVLCPDLDDTDPIIDSLMTMIRVQRMYKDTFQMRLCTGDTLRDIHIFRDSFPNQDVWDRYYRNEISMAQVEASKAAYDTTTFFVGYKTGAPVPTKKDFVLPLESGFHRFTRQYVTVSGCDSIVTLDIYVCDTVHTRVPDAPEYNLTLENNYQIVFPDGDNIMFSGQTITEPGVYFDTLHTTYCPSCTLPDTIPYHVFMAGEHPGCDSIIELHVGLLETIEHHFCDSLWDADTNSKYLLPPSQFQTEVLEGHRDQVICLTDTTGPYSFDQIQQHTIELAKTLHGSDKVVEYKATMQTVDQMDSSILFRLYVDPLEIVEYSKMLTKDDDYTWRADLYDGSRPRVDTYGPWETLPDGNKEIHYFVEEDVPADETECGIRIHRLTISFGNLAEDTIRICDIESYEWRKHSLNAEGDYEAHPHHIVTDKFCELNPAFDCSADDVTRFNVANVISAGGYRHMKLDDTLHCVSNPALDSVRRLHIYYYPTYLGDYAKDSVKHICWDDEFDFGGNTYNGRTYSIAEGDLQTVDHLSATFPVSRSVRDGLHGGAGCDSTMNIELHIWRNYIIGDTVYLAWDSIANPDSTYLPDYLPANRAVRLKDVYHSADRHYEFTGFTLTTRDPNRAIQCDSTRFTHLYVGAVQRIDSVKHICANDETYTWHTKSYPRSEQEKKDWKKLTATTIIRDTIRNVGRWDGGVPSGMTRDQVAAIVQNLDSTNYLELHVHPIYLNQHSDKVCQDKTPGVYYSWAGHGDNQLYVFGQTGRVPANKIPLNIATTYTLIDSLKTKTCPDCHEGGIGCDSIEVLILTINPIYEHPLEKDSVCQKSYYWWADHQLAYENVPSATPFFDEDGDPVTISTEAPSTATEPYYTYIDRLTTIQGCDSSYTLNLFVHPVYNELTDTVRIDSTFCHRDVRDGYTWAGNTISEVGVHVLIHKFETKLCHCDSIVKYTVTIYNDEDVLHTDQRCSNHMDTIYEHHESLDWNTWPRNIWHDHIVPVQNIATDGHVCEYYDTLRLYMQQAYETLSKRDSICQTPDGLYTWSEHVNGDATTACDPARMVWDVQRRRHIAANAIPASRVGEYVYIDSMTTAVCACDSIWTLRLRVDSVYSKSETHTMCDNEYLIWQNHLFIGKTFKDTGDPLPSGSFKHKMVVDTDLTHDTTYQTIHGCDSAFHLSLVVKPAYPIAPDTTIVKISAMDGVYYRFYNAQYVGKNYNPIRTTTDPGTPVEFYSPLKGHGYTTQHCDSAVVHRLFIYPAYKLEQTASICLSDTLPGARFKMDGHEVYIEDIRSAGTYTKELSYVTHVGQTLFLDPQRPTEHIYDSIYTLVLTVNPSYEIPVNSTICSNDTISWERTLFAGCDFDEEAHPLQPSIAGYYDSIVRLNNVSSYDYAHYDVTPLGCDSNRFWHLTINPIRFTQLFERVADNDSTWSFGHGTNYVDASAFHVPDYSIEHREPYWVEFIDTLSLSDTGCDDIIHDSVLVCPSYRFVLDTAVCTNIDWDWRKYKLMNTRQNGTYYDSLKTVQGFDSVYVLNLTVIPIFNQTMSAKVCKNDTLEWQHQRVYYQPENNIPGVQIIYTATYQAEGSHCDSIYRLEVQFHDFYHYAEEVDTTCQFTDYHWMDSRTGREHLYGLRDVRGRRFQEIPTDTTGWITMYDSLKTKACDCDSIYTLHLFVKPAYRSYDTTYIMCQGETIHWQNREILATEQGILRDTAIYTNRYGCDSTYYFQARVFPSYLHEATDTICYDALPYVWHNAYTPSAHKASTWKNDSVLVLWDSCQTVHGCDSIYKMELYVRTVTYSYKVDTICFGDTLIFNGRYCADPGIYVDTLASHTFCDSVDVLDLAVIYPTIFKITQPEVCANDNFYDIGYSFVGPEPVAFTIVYDSFAMAHGFDTVANIPLQPGDVSLTVPMPERAGKDDYIEPNVYNAKILFDNAVCLNYELTSVPFTFELRYPSRIIEQHWNDFIGILVPELNGGYTFDKYQWFRNDTLLVGETGPYLYAPHWLDPSAHYAVALTRTGESDSIMTCPIQPTLHVDNPLPSMPYISVVPNIVVRDHPVVNILSLNSGFYRLYDAFGQLIQRAQFEPCDDHHAYEVTLPAMSGVYLFELHENTGLTRTVKVIVL